MSKKSASAPVGRGPIHDSSYKLLYSHLAMVSDLLQGFIPGAWVDGLDLATLEKCNGSYISDDLRDRTDDLIWRVRWGHDWLYVYCCSNSNPASTAGWRCGSRLIMEPTPGMPHVFSTISSSRPPRCCTATGRNRPISCSTSSAWPSKAICRNGRGTQHVVQSRRKLDRLTRLARHRRQARPAPTAGDP